MADQLPVLLAGSNLYCDDHDPPLIQLVPARMKETMPHYRFHLYNSVGFIEDYEGVTLPDLEAARHYAIAAARSIMCDELQHGRMDLRGWIDVMDASGSTVIVLPFGDAIEIINGLLFGSAEIGPGDDG